MRRRVTMAALIAVLLAGAGVALKAEGGPYRPLICQSFSLPDDIFWWVWYECWLDPSPDQVQG